MADTNTSQTVWAVHYRRTHHRSSGWSIEYYRDEGLMDARVMDLLLLHQGWPNPGKRNMLAQVWWEMRHRGEERPDHDPQDVYVRRFDANGVTTLRPAVVAPSLSWEATDG